MRVFTYLFFITTLITLCSASNDLIDLTSDERAFIQKHPTIRVGGETDWPPYDFVENGVYKGVAKEYLDLISKKSGLKFEITTGYTWPELLELTKNKKIDLLPILTQLPKRAEYIEFTKPYITMRQYLYTNQESKSFNTIEDLYGKKIAIPKGYASITSMKEKYPQIEIVETKNVLDSIDHLITQKVDGLIENNALVNYLLKKHNIVGIAPILSVNLASDMLNMGVRKDWPILRDIIQKSLDSITEIEKTKVSEKWISLKQSSPTLQLSAEERAYIENNPIIKVANQIAWRPFDYYEDSQAKGYAVDFIKVLAQKANLNVEFVHGKWSNLQNDFKQGKIDLFPILAKNKSREEFMNFTASHIKLDQAIVTQKFQSQINSLEDLYGKKISLVKGWNITKLIEKSYPQIKIVYVENNQQKLEAVAFGEVDATIASFTIANYLINQHFLNNLKITSKVTVKGHNPSLHIGIQKENLLLYSIMSKALNSFTGTDRAFLNAKWQAGPTNKDIVFTDKEQAFIEKNVITFSGSKRWAPFISQERNETAYGIIIDYWKLIAQKAGLKYEIKLYDVFDNALLAIKNKEVDILSTGETTDRKSYSIFSNRFEAFPLSIATLDDEKYIPNAQSLIGEKIAVGKNFSAHRILKNNHQNLEFVLTNNTPDALKLVAANEAFATVDAAPTLIHYINHLGLNNIKISGHTGYNFDLKFMIREDYDTLQSIINKTITAISPVQKQEIYNRWIQVNYQQAFDYGLLWRILGVISIIFAILLYFHLRSLKHQKEIQKAHDQLKLQSEELEESNEIIQQTQIELEKSLDNFMSLVDSTIEAILIIKDREIIYVNDEAADLFKVKSRTNFIGREIEEFFSKRTINQALIAIDNAESNIEEIIAKRDNNESFPALVKIKNIQFQNIEAKTVSVIDLTDLKNKERLIQEQSKMVAIGEMIGNIAHQWRQPLSIISTSASALDLYKNSGKLNDEVFFRSTSNILKNTQFLSQTIDDFRNFIKTNKQCLFFELSNTLNKTLVLVEASLKNGHVKVIMNNDQKVELNNYENELIQALLNILNNSKDALKVREIEERLIFIDLFVEDEIAFIRIRDNGGGIDEEVIGHIFEPYFTTKHKSMGTGLGLYMTHKIIFESMQGRIKVKNVQFPYEQMICEGAEFLIELPVNLNKTTEG